MWIHNGTVDSYVAHHDDVNDDAHFDVIDIINCNIDHDVNDVNDGRNDVEQDTDASSGSLQGS